MPGEITVTGSIQVRKTHLVDNKNPGSLQVDFNGKTKSHLIQSIGTTEEALNINADVAIGGWAFVQNMDPTNFVEVGLKPVSTFHPFLKLKPGEWNLVRVATLSLFAKFDTAAGELEHLIYDD